MGLLAGPLVGALAWAPPAAAASNDIQLLGLIDVDANGVITKDQDSFRALVRELGVVMTPASLQPAETTGQSGFDFGLDYTFHTMRFNESYWRDTREDPSVPLLMTLGARVRKGFILPAPLTSEIELGAQWLIDSRLMNLGTNFRVALNEGFRWIPDIAVQAGFNRMVGSKDLDLLTVTAGGQISKGFGVAGSINLCPFVGYQSIWVNGSTRILDAGPQDSSNLGDNEVFDIVGLAQNRLDRFSVGARVIIAVVQLTGGLDINRLEPVAGTNAGGAPELLLQYSVRAGVTF
jgi:hypothetical protein